VHEEPDAKYSVDPSSDSRNARICGPHAIVVVYSGMPEPALKIATCSTPYKSSVPATMRVPSRVTLTRAGP
jgi:hypothetical protein